MPKKFLIDLIKYYKKKRFKFHMSLIFNTKTKRQFNDFKANVLSLPSESPK